MKKLVFIALWHLVSLPAISQNLLQSSGNIGVGTTSPTQELEVNGTGLFTATGSGLAHNTRTGLYLLDGAIWSLAGGSGHDLSLYSKSLIFNTGSVYAETMRLSYDGNLGINTASPTQKLTVNGAGLFSGTSLTGTSGVNGTYVLNGRVVSLSGTNMADLSLEAASLVFKTGTSPLETMRVSASGNMGIGDASPAEKLSVTGNIKINGNGNFNGTVIAKKIQVSQSAWADYVFDKDYKLRSLSSLETFIKANGHLPEVPTAKQVQEKGISVGDNQALLLKKIEELALYIIDLKKENQKQQSQIDYLVKNKK